MNLRRSTLLALALVAAVAPLSPARAELVLPRVSQKSTLTQTVGITDLTIAYCRPGVKGRPIWGALVPFDKPWRTGANEATTFTATDDITVAGKPLAAGTYSFLTIPANGEWSVIFSKQKDLWGGSTDYDPKQDVLRVSVKPEAADAVEWMRFTFENLSPSSADLVLRWEKLQVTVPIAVETQQLTLTKARAELAVAKPDDWRTPYRAAQYTFEQGIALVPEDRKAHGLILDQKIKTNISITVLQQLEKWGVVLHNKKETQLSKEYIQQLGIKTHSENNIAGNLSGGNQQKIVLAKWLATKPKILLLDEPTRGIDINAKNEIYKLILQLADEGLGIIVVSSELPEILGMSDRILVMHRGRIAAEFAAEQATQESILHAALGQ